MKNVTVHLKPWIIICRGHIWYKKFAGKKKIRNRNYNSKSGIFLNCEDATFINHIHCFVRCLHWIIKNPTQSVNTDCVGFLHTILALLLGEGKDGVEDAEVEAAFYGNPTAVGTLRVK